MSTHKVTVTKIVELVPHPNADRLELATVYGWNCVVPKGVYKPGDLCVYIPIDSILPGAVESKVFGETTKVKLSKSRVKTIKLRGAISQGLVVDPTILGLSNVKEEEDVTTKLGITKYEPPAESTPQSQAQQVSKALANPSFHKYTGLENIKNYPTVFEPGDEVIVTEKIHGTNFRAGWVPFHADTLLKKIKKFLFLAPKYEFVYGSHNVQLQSKSLESGETQLNVYAEAVKNYNLKEVLKPGEVVYGEVYGDGVQKGYKYGCGNGVRKLVAFDIMKDGTYLSPVEFSKRATEAQLETAPVLYAGIFNLEHVKSLSKGDSVLAPVQKVREGVVVKPLIESKCFIGRKVLKVISDEYLLKDQTDFH